MKHERLNLSQHQFVETSKDFNGRYWIAYSSGASVFLREAADLRRFLKLAKGSKGLPMRERLDEWLAGLAAADAERETRLRDPQEDLSIAGELQATGFGPECHPDDDPTANTRTII
jgi:hypothetical protein